MNKSEREKERGTERDEAEATRGLQGVERQREPTLCSCETITTMGYRTAAIAGEMPNGLQDRAGLAVRVCSARSGMADETGGKQAGRKGGKEKGISSGRLFLSASALLPSLLLLLLPARLPLPL